MLGTAVAQEMVAQEEKEVSLNQWTCRNAKVEGSNKKSSSSLKDVKATGKAMVGAEEARSYRFSVMDENSRKEMPVTLYVSASTGLPLKIEMSQPQGSMVMEYYDFNAPIAIDLPACMKH
jgi:hypothetical protein